MKCIISTITNNFPQKATFIYSNNNVSPKDYDKITINDMIKKSKLYQNLYEYKDVNPKVFVSDDLIYTINIELFN